MKTHFTRFVLFFFFLGIIQLSYAQSSDLLWYDVPESSISTTSPRYIIPNEYRVLQLSEATLANLLFSAPDKNSGKAATIELPMPDGKNLTFAFYKASVMEPELAAKFPEIQTFAGYSVDNPAVHLRMDITPAGFHAMIRMPNQTVYIDPYSFKSTTHIISYFQHDYVKQNSNFECLLHDEDVIDNHVNESIHIDNQVKNPSGTELRSYRLALAATGEYTSFHGGTVAAAMAAIVTSVNRVVGVYEDEVGVTMVLVANNNLIVYTNSSTDPYTNNDGYAMLAQNQTNVDAIIGSANYDIGHVFSTGGGGIAGLGVPCVNGQKARGVTGSYSPVGDPFDIDYVAHEMGHQFGASHTFNSESGSCSGNRTASAAYEPGSGSTIMAYAGICGAHNIQPHSDPYFHSKSFEQIFNYTNTGSGNNCPVTTQTGNTPPVSEANAFNINGMVIPKSTPFIITGAGSDDDGDQVYYCWEEYDLGPAGHPNTPTGNAPTFRSFNPTVNPYRIFPKWQNVLSGSPTIGEVLPSYSRNLKFRLTVRDYRPGGGGVHWSLLSISVDDEAGPFKLNAPDNLSIWAPLTTQIVRWDVANTNTGDINCQTVNILLSTDGGTTFNYTLAENVPNNGLAVVEIPNVTSETCRIIVEAADNIFFNITKSFKIVDCSPMVVIVEQPVDVNACIGDVVEFSVVAQNVTSYQWRKDYVNIAGATSNTYTISSVYTTNSGIYDCFLTGCAQLTTNSVTLSVGTQQEKPSITQNIFDLVSSSETGNQWYFENNLIEGAVEQIYTPTANGNYTVVVSDNGCASEVSDQFVYSSIGINELNNATIQITPNPSNGEFTVLFNSNFDSEIKVVLLSIEGKEVMSRVYNKTTKSATINAQNLQKGMYFLKISVGNKIFMEKVIIN